MTESDSNHPPLVAVLALLVAVLSMKGVGEAWHYAAGTLGASMSICFSTCSGRASQRREFAADDVAALEKQIAPWACRRRHPVRMVRRRAQRAARAGFGCRPQKCSATRSRPLSLRRSAAAGGADCTVWRRRNPWAVRRCRPNRAARHNVAAYETMLGTQLPAAVVEALLENFVTMNTGD